MPLILDPRWTSIPSLTSLRLQIAPGICTISGNTCVVYTVPATQPTQLSSIRVAARQRRSLGLRLHNRAEEGLNGSTSAAVHDPLATLTSYCVLHFDRVSQCCAILALLCVLSVLCPIIFDNARQLAHGAAGPVAEEVWQELLQDVFAFVGLTSVFIGLGEAGSGLVHGTGAVLYSVFFLQLAWADAAPASMGILVAGVLVASAIVNSAKAIQWLEGRHAWLWTLWTDALAVLGWALLPFLFNHNFLGGAAAHGAWPSLASGATAGAIVTLKRCQLLHKEAAGFWDRNGLALAATATFMMEGVMELVHVTQNSTGFIPRQVMLNTGMVALLIPRSLFTQDSMFFIDIVWNALLGWGQLAVLFSLRHTLTGPSHLSGAAFSAATIGLAALLMASLRVACRANTWGGTSQHEGQPTWLPAARLVAFPFEQLARLGAWVGPSRGAILIKAPARRQAASLGQHRSQS